MKTTAYGKNPHGIDNPESRGHPWSRLGYNWLGAQVQIKLFGEWRDAAIVLVNNYDGQLKAEIREGSKVIAVLAAYQAFRKTPETVLQERLERAKAALKWLQEHGETEEDLA